jgi:hypothetical protein
MLGPHMSGFCGTLPDPGRPLNVLWKVDEPFCCSSGPEPEGREQARTTRARIAVLRRFGACSF